MNHNIIYRINAKHHTAALLFTNNVGGRNSNQGGRGLSPIVERSIDVLNPADIWKKWLGHSAKYSCNSPYYLNFLEHKYKESYQKAQFTILLNATFLLLKF